MKADVIKLDGGSAGTVDLDEALFGLEPRADILHRVVRWQRNKAQAGTHKVKTRSETSYSTLAKQVKELGWKRALIIDGADIDANFALAAANIDGLDVLPSMGANVYDILKRDTLVITKAGVEALEARLK